MKIAAKKPRETSVRRTASLKPRSCHSFPTFGKEIATGLFSFLRMFEWRSDVISSCPDCTSNNLRGSAKFHRVRCFPDLHFRVSGQTQLLLATKEHQIKVDKLICRPPQQVFRGHVTNSGAPSSNGAHYDERLQSLRICRVRTQLSSSQALTHETSKPTCERAYPLGEQRDSDQSAQPWPH